MPVLGIVLLASLSTLYWLGLSSHAALLIVVFVFSLRDFLFPSSCSLDVEGLTVSSPLLGAKFYPWESIHDLTLESGNPLLHLRSGRLRRLPPLPSALKPRGDLEARISEWMDVARTAAKGESAGDEPVKEDEALS